MSKIENKLNTEEEILFNKFARKLKLNSRNDYLAKILMFKEFIDKDLSDIDRNDCKNFIEYIQNIYAKSTCEKIYSYLHSFYNFILGEGYILENYFKDIKKPSVTRVKSKDDVLSKDEINTILNSLDKLSVRDRLIMIILITTGCLLNELVNLKWKDIIYENDSNYIKLGKNKKERTIKLHPLCVTSLNEYKDYLGIENSKIVRDDFIIISQKSNSITDRNVRTIVKKALSLCNLDNYSAKDFRHTFAAISLRDGEDETILKEKLGWSDKHYALRYRYVLNFVDDEIKMN